MDQVGIANYYIHITMTICRTVNPYRFTFKQVRSDSKYVKLDKELMSGSEIIESDDVVRTGTEKEDMRKTRYKNWNRPGSELHLNKLF